MPCSQAWREFIVNRREAMQLLRADPTHARPGAHGFATKSELALSAALTNGCVMLMSGRLQGCIESQAQEFLERIDESGVVVNRLPEALRAALCSQYFAGRRQLKPHQVAELHERYAVLWIDGSRLPEGTLKTNSLPDRIWNPRPDRVRTLMQRCDIDLFDWIDRRHGRRYREDMMAYVEELVEVRNAVAHGAPATAWTTGDVVLRMQWASRLAYACDQAFGDRLSSITGHGW